MPSFSAINEQPVDIEKVSDVKTESVKRALEPLYKELQVISQKQQEKAAVASIV